MLIELTEVSKSFGGTMALDNVSFPIAQGSIHALVGENGAGKSTLAKILSGSITPDRGKIAVGGDIRDVYSPYRALQAGIASMQQEICLSPDLTVAQNIVLGREPRRGPFLRGGVPPEVKLLIEQTGFDLDPCAPVGELPLAKQQQVEILRALASKARLIIMDEPTAALEAQDVRRLHGTVRDLSRRGISVLFISHFLEEVLELSDTVTVMRNGQHVQTRPAGDYDVDTLIEAMLGRHLSGMFPTLPAFDDNSPARLVVNDVKVPGRVQEFRLSVKPGEAVGLYGLVGSGRSEAALALFGADSAAQVSASLEGTHFHPQRPMTALRRGLCLLPESRKDQGLFLGLDQRRNTSANITDRLGRFGFLSKREESKAVTAALEDVTVDRVCLSEPVSLLSGGNQQKVLLAKCLISAPKVLILDEPTRGVDVGARQAIYDRICRLLEDGMSLILISSDIEEVTHLAHRVIVMHQGRMSGEFSGPDYDNDKILAAAFGRDKVKETMAK